MKKFFLALFLTIATTAMAQTVSHTVKVGETLTTIAAQYGISVDQLRAANPDLNTTFYAGMDLNIPGVYTKQAESRPDEYTRAKVRFRPSGYNGYVEWSSGFDVDDAETFNYALLTTIHGYRFNPHIFLGAGIQFNYIYDDYYGEEMFNAPVFADFRYNILMSRCTPFLEARLGYDFIGESDDFYGAFQFGVDVALGRRFGLTAGINLSTQSIYDFSYRRYDEYDPEPLPFIGFSFGLHF